MTAGFASSRTSTEPRSVLIFGSGESAMSALAAGLAERVRPEFAWANCSGSTSHWDRSIAGMMEQRSSGRRAVSPQSADFRIRESGAEALGRVVVPESLSGRMRQRLIEFVRLPPLLQRLISFAPAEGDPVSVVLTNVDGMPDQLLESALALPSLHEALHDEGVTLFVTFRGTPAPALKEAFDQIYRIEPPIGGTWLHSFVSSERGLETTDLLLPQTLSDAWAILGLNPQLIAQ